MTVFYIQSASFFNLSVTFFLARPVVVSDLGGQLVGCERAKLFCIKSKLNDAERCGDEAERWSTFDVDEH